MNVESEIQKLQKIVTEMDIELDRLNYRVKKLESGEDQWSK